MGMFDGLLGGIVGAGMVSVVSGILEKHGGLQGVVNEFERNGLGATVQSWVGTGPNQTISQDAVHRVLGPDLLQQRLPQELLEDAEVQVPEDLLAEVPPAEVELLQEELLQLRLW